MTISKTVLVLGAGASRAMGYPTGAELRQCLIDLGDHPRRHIAEAAGLLQRPEFLDSFVDAFKRSQMNSIDAFLARRPEFSEIGKHALATILLSFEDKRKLSNCEHDDHWYRYFFNTVSADSWSQFNLSAYAIVTFNYDRSFEHYLLNAIMHAYNVPAKEAIEKLSELEVIHVYGTLGAVFPVDNGYFEYGSAVSPTTVSKAATSLRVIPEGRNSDPTLSRAREILSEARTIGFLGFSFDKTNLERLDSTVTCKADIRQGRTTSSRRVFATCYGMFAAEARIAHQLTAARTSLNSGTFPEGFHASTCLEMLRMTQLLRA